MVNGCFFFFYQNKKVLTLERFHTKQIIMCILLIVHTIRLYKLIVVLMDRNVQVTLGFKTQRINKY